MAVRGWRGGGGSTLGSGGLGTDLSLRESPGEGSEEDLVFHLGRPKDNILNCPVPLLQASDHFKQLLCRGHGVMHPKAPPAEDHYHAADVDNDVEKPLCLLQGVNRPLCHLPQHRLALRIGGDGKHRPQAPEPLALELLRQHRERV